MSCARTVERRPSAPTKRSASIRSPLTQTAVTFSWCCSQPTTRRLVRTTPSPMAPSNSACRRARCRATVGTPISFWSLAKSISAPRRFPRASRIAARVITFPAATVADSSPSRASSRMAFDDRARPAPPCSRSGMRSRQVTWTPRRRSATARVSPPIPPPAMMIFETMNGLSACAKLLKHSRPSGNDDMRTSVGSLPGKILNICPGDLHESLAVGTSFLPNWQFSIWVGKLKG